MLPWVLDHALMDAELVRRWQGGDVDLTRRLPSDLVLAAAAQDPRINASVAGYLAMTELPASLDPVRPLAPAVYETGWRPPYSPGPTRDELLAVVGSAGPPEGSCCHDGRADEPRQISAGARPPRRAGRRGSDGPRASAG